MACGGSAEHSLLFGLLALHAGLVDGDALVAVISQWTSFSTSLRWLPASPPSIETVISPSWRGSTLEARLASISSSAIWRRR